MTFQLDQATLQSITQEVRQCFLSQDAPEYMNILERGLENRDGDFKSLLRAAHSLKGGAGVAELPSLNDLAHKLEDLLQIMEKREVQDEELAWLILERGVTEVAFLLDQAGTGQEVQVDPELLQTLAAFQQSQTTVGARTETVNGPNNSFIVTALQQDLEDSFATVEELPADTPEEIVRECLENFCDECLFLGETLDLVWLIEGVAPLEAVREEADTSAALTLALDAIANLRTVRDRYLTVQLEPAENKEAEDAVLDSVEDTTPHSSIPDTSLSHLRVPLKQLEDITNTVEELILTQERLREQQRQLTQANLRLRQLAHQFEPIREQIQSFYDQLAITPEGMASVNPALTGPALLGLKPQAMEFDRLELDRFTTLHSSLQTFQELMLRVREVRADINLINYYLNKNLEYDNKKINKLYGSITQSRLVTFGLLAQRFLPQIQNLNRRYPHKLVVLEIKGEEVLVDQLLLEQLQTPLTHLLNNAFDHGITPRAARVDNGKPETATIVLKAARSQNQLVITITDDGEGINLERVYRAALERGLCPTSSDMDQFSTEEILQWIFQPDFSTAPKVSELSGRGMGLDIVRSQVQRLRGTIQVETEVGQGTIFTLKFPRSLSKVSLLLVQLQGRIVAIPTASIRETLLFKELEWLQLEPPVANWYSQAVSVIPLSEIFSVIVMANHNRKGIGSNLALGPKIGIVLDCSFGPLVVTADGLISSEEFIVKPFDEMGIAPPYLAGCTILGTGEVVPVLLPQALEKSILVAQKNKSGSIPVRKIPTILVAEDSVATRRLLERLLTEIGYNSVLCRDGQEVLDKLEENRGLIDLVISDLEMPRVNGFELLHLLRSHEKWQDLPLVMLTSRTGERHRQEVIQRGANAYLGKPIQPFLKKVATVV